jgi:hypothetical protein
MLMARFRRGMDTGRGKGYRNIRPMFQHDRRVHQLAGKGIKSPQRMPFMLKKGTVQEHKEHPSFSVAQAQQIAKDHITENPTYYGKKEKIGIKYILITRLEGSSKEDYNLGVTQRFNSVAQADTRLREISATVPKSGGYDKTDVKVVFKDGHTYEGRWDVKHYTQPDNDTSIGQHLRESLNFKAGLTERGKEWIKKGYLKKPDVKQAKNFLKKYEFGGKCGWKKGGKLSAQDKRRLTQVLNEENEKTESNANIFDVIRKTQLRQKKTFDYFENNEAFYYLQKKGASLE